MKLDEAKREFIQAWGTLGSQWGINKAMAQVHALLLISPESLSTDEIMEQLNISRGNANMNSRALISWGIVRKEHRLGERKEYFAAEKDIWKVTKQVLAERKKRELQPVIQVLDQVEHIDGPKNDKDVEAFTSMIAQLKSFTASSNKTLEKLMQADEHWFWGSFMKMMR